MTREEFFNLMVETNAEYDIINVICNCFTKEEIEYVFSDTYDPNDLDEVLVKLITYKINDKTNIIDIVNLEYYIHIQNLYFDYDSLLDDIRKYNSNELNDDEVFDPNFDEEPNDDEAIDPDEVIKIIKELFEELNKWK